MQVCVGTRVHVLWVQASGWSPHDIAKQGSAHTMVCRSIWLFGVGPLVALQYWLLITLGQQSARSEYGHFGAIPIRCWIWIFDQPKVWGHPCWRYHACGDWICCSSSPTWINSALSASGIVQQVLFGPWQATFTRRIYFTTSSSDSIQVLCSTSAS